MKVNIRVRVPTYSPAACSAPLRHALVLLTGRVFIFVCTYADMTGRN